MIVHTPDLTIRARAFSRLALLLPSLALLPATATAQSEDELRTAFEGRRVVVRLDLPATAKGLDVRPGESRPVDYPSLAKRYKSSGIGIRAGDTALVTKVKVKDDLIEFQLDGGGYGTFGDRATEPTGATPPMLGESDEERQLRKLEKTERDPAKQREYRAQLARARSERERSNALTSAVAQGSEIELERYRRERAAMGGSRINLRWERRVPDAALTPDGLRELLAKYVTVLPEQVAVE